MFDRKHIHHEEITRIETKETGTSVFYISGSTMMEDYFVVEIIVKTGKARIAFYAHGDLSDSNKFIYENYFDSNVQFSDNELHGIVDVLLELNGVELSYTPVGQRSEADVILSLVQQVETLRV